jgi:hypothetical protein
MLYEEPIETFYETEPISRELEHVVLLFPTFRSWSFYFLKLEWVK